MNAKASSTPGWQPTISNVAEKLESAQLRSAAEVLWASQPTGCLRTWEFKVKPNNKPLKLSPVLLNELWIKRRNITWAPK